jgi:hypothetical protein
MKRVAKLGKPWSRCDSAGLLAGLAGLALSACPSDDKMLDLVRILYIAGGIGAFICLLARRAWRQQARHRERYCLILTTALTTTEFLYAAHSELVDPLKFQLYTPHGTLDVMIYYSFCALFGGGIGFIFAAAGNLGLRYRRTLKQSAVGHHARETGFSALLGDLVERRALIDAQQGKDAAREWYWTQLLISLPPLVWASIRQGVSFRRFVGRH